MNPKALRSLTVLARELARAQELGYKSPDARWIAINDAILWVLDQTCRSHPQETEAALKSAPRARWRTR